MMMLNSFLSRYLLFSLTLPSVLAVSSTNSAADPSPPLPIVDLGYVRQQASSFDNDGQYYNFSNIRYGAPPLGDLRFRAPQPPENTKDVDNGSIGRVCPQGPTPWLLIAEEYLPYHSAGLPFNYSTSQNTTTSSGGDQSAADQDPRITEDCLFLDLYVPSKVFQNASTDHNGAPVLVWITGGGYVQGDKQNNGQWNPRNLIQASQLLGDNGMIFVSINYRLGAFGWLGGSTLLQDGTANVGLHDQRLALEWVQEKVHLFGGDKSRVTVIGESAGGGSIIHHITAYGGLYNYTPFARAIPQSPAWLNMPGNVQQEKIFQSFLSRLKVSSIEEARKLPSEVLMQANSDIVANSQYGRYTFGPGVDGSFVPASPAQLLLHGQFDKSVTVMTGYNSDEGFLFTDPHVTSDAAFADLIYTSYPDIDASTTEYLTKTLYPAVFDGTQPYRTQYDRASLLSGESAIVCNTYYLHNAFGNNTFGYEFAVFPGIHGQDLNYTFYHGPNPTVTDPGVAMALQEYIVNFAVDGRPGKAGGASSMFPDFPLYGSEAQILSFVNGSDIYVTTDRAANARCAWWQKALYY